MDSDARMDLVKAMFDEFVTKGSGEMLFQHLADDVVWRATAPATTPLHGRFIGPPGVAEYFRRSAELVAMENTAVTGFFQDGERIVVLGSERLRSRRIDHTQDLDWATVIRFQHERIAEVLVIEDLSILIPG